MLYDSSQEVQTVAGACSSLTQPPASTPPSGTISDTRTSYDGLGFGASPTKGDPTTDAALMTPGASPVWATTVTGYDSLGRPTSVIAPTKPAATVAYTPAASTSADTGPLTSTAAVTAPLAGSTTGWKTTTTYNPAWGTSTSTTDANNNVTTVSYDPLGRRSAVWLPNRPQAANPTSPSTSYAYNVSTTQPTTVSTTTLDAIGKPMTSVDLLDGMLRPRQTQTPNDGGGSIVTDTFYDAAGRIVTADGNYGINTAPSTTLYLPSQPQNLPSQTRTVWDGDGRKVSDTLWSDASAQFSTTYSYGGDRVSVTPPAGATPTTTVTDARGQTTALLQYHGATPTGAHDETDYTYTPAGKLATMTTAGASWAYTYDLLGNTLTATDPDTGTTVNTYDTASRLSTTTDARGQLLSYSYDNADRKTDQYQGTTSGTKLAHWSYDSAAAGTGLPASSTRYVGTDAYTESVTGYTPLGKPTGTTITLPASQGTALQGDHTTSYTYNVDGSAATTVDPAEGGLAKETLTNSYDNHGMPAGLANGIDYYAFQVDYSLTDQVAAVQGSSTTEYEKTWTYQDGTNRLVSGLYDVATNTSVTTPATDTYTYDNAGDVTSQTETANDGSIDAQCFAYDYLQRLTTAFTPTTPSGTTPGGTCSNTPTSTSVGGPAPYWQTYTYDASGNRSSITRHGTTATAPSTETDSSYSNAAHSHAVTSTVNTTTTASGTVTTKGPYNYKYDADGNTTVRPGEPTLAWDATGKLTSVQVGSTTTNTQRNVYDADGNLLIQTDPTAGTTAYLGDTELHRAPGATTATGVRTYTYLGTTVAERVSKTNGANTLTWTDADPRGTVTPTSDDLTGAITHRYLDPFGNSRGVTVPWQDNHGYLNAPTDTFTALTHLGARDYDVALGRFESVDAVFSKENPQQDEGYSYAENNPETNVDPAGTCSYNAASIQDDCRYGSDTNSGDGHNAQNVASVIAGNSPKSNDPNELRKDFFNGSGWGPSTNYWHPYDGSQPSCFGQPACGAAFAYLSNNPNDVQGAKRIAATYCLGARFAVCQSEAEAQGTYGEAVALFALGAGLVAGAIDAGAAVSANGPATGVAAETATTSVGDILMPGGNAIGKAGTDATIREISGGYTDAQAMFNQLSQGGRVVANTSKLTRVELPNGGFVQLRTVMSRSPNTAATIDVNIPGLDVTKLKYNP